MKPLFYKTKPKFKNKIKFIDVYPSAVKELFFLNNLQIKKGSTDAEKKLSDYKVKDAWIYYKEQNILVHTVNEKDYFKLRTSRNREIITSEEQNNFRNLTVGIAGLSVGSAILHTLVKSGGPKNLKIADYDSLEATNLNRITANLLDLGQNKTLIAAKAVYELDPYANLKTFPKGLGKKNLKDFILSKPKLNVFIDAMDNFSLKIYARELCKKHHIPVIMATDNGFGVILDIERFDLEPNRQIFHGRLKQYNSTNLNSLDFKGWLNLAIQLIGPENFSEGIKRSLKHLGKTIPSIPQLGLAANLAGGAVTTALIKLANKQKLSSGRYLINLEKTF
jgi:molybdopterin/thiamine biosynthesis adenylyltransferase